MDQTRRPMYSFSDLQKLGRDLKIVDADTLVVGTYSVDDLMLAVVVGKNEADVQMTMFEAMDGVWKYLRFFGASWLDVYPRYIDLIPANDIWFPGPKGSCRIDDRGVAVAAGVAGRNVQQIEVRAADQRFAVFPQAESRVFAFLCESDVPLQVLPNLDISR